MPRTAGLAACMLFVAIAAASAQSSADNQTELDLGRAALARDPAAEEAAQADGDEAPIAAEADDIGGKD